MFHDKHIWHVVAIALGHTPRCCQGERRLMTASEASCAFISGNCQLSLLSNGGDGSIVEPSTAYILIDIGRFGELTTKKESSNRKLSFYEFLCPALPK